MQIPLYSAGHRFLLGAIFGLAVAPSVFSQQPSAEAKFRAVTIDRAVQIGYGVAVADVDGDKQPDVLLADKKQFVWYRNPGKEQAGEEGAWKKHVLAENLTPRDNVCIAAQDIDGDGKCEVAVGGDWAPADTENSGAVFYLVPPDDRTKLWSAVKLPAEVTTHRMRWVGLDDGKWGLVVVPLHGKGNKNAEGAGVKVLLYHPPAQRNDSAAEWKTELVDDTMHATHNFEPLKVQKDTGIALGGREGFKILHRKGAKWDTLLAIQSTQVPGAPNPLSKGVGEVRAGRLKGEQFMTSVEPMHGNELAVYLKGEHHDKPQRVLLSDKLVEGHALACADVLGLGVDQIVIGWRGKPEQMKSIGVAIWSATDEKGTTWKEQVIDPDNMACEDLQVADLNGDGKLDIVAAGRSTKNLKIYLNERAAP